MTKNIRLIVMGTLTIVSLLLALPFTPLRNSFPEKISSYISEAPITGGLNTSENFKIGRQIVKSRQLEAFGLDVNTFSYKKNSVRSTNVDILNNNTYAYSAYLQKENTNSKSGGNEASGISFSKSSNGFKKSDIRKVGSISTTVNRTNSSSTVGTKTLQAATKQTYGEGQGGTHPGLDPETPIPSLPLGDGTAALLIFGLIFGVLKAKIIDFITIL